MQINDQLLDQVLVLLAKQQKLEAMKVVKSTLGCSLSDAKSAVDRLEAEQLAHPLPMAAAKEIDWQAEVKDLLLQGKKLHAIKVCRERTGCGLKEAAEQVEALALRHGINPRSGCLGVLLLIVTIGCGTVAKLLLLLNY